MRSARATSGADDRTPEFLSSRLLDWEQLGALQRSGVHLGAHTCTHPRLTTLEGDALEREIVGSKQRLARESASTPTRLPIRTAL